MNSDEKPEEIEKIKETLLEKSSMDTMSSFYSVFADPTRLSIVSLLINHELCVNDIASILGISQSRVSHQLAILRQHDIVTYYRKGKQVLYTLTDNHIKYLFTIGLEHLSEQDENLCKDKIKKGY